MLSSFSFDSSVASIFWTLLSGGELWLPPEGAQQNIGRITDFVRHGPITHLLALPSLYQSLLLNSTNDQLRSLRTVIVAGETVYEATSAQHPGPVPIGTPIANAEIKILDAQMRPAPPTEPGEVYIGGPQLARGYLGRPDLTAERFLPHAFTKVPGTRLYRTGDLAKYRADGNIDFLGREDQQVKIRGYRIELGEIESALREHPQVLDAAVAGRKDAEGHQRLVAYVVSGAEKIDAVALRRFLRKCLPEYMTPATYVTLESLPMNANGKLDRQALPDPAPAESQNTYVAPRTQVERTLAQIWADLLGVKQVGTHDNFFELGGDSILGLQMAARANQAGIRLNITQISEQPTIAGLAATCTSADSALETATRP